MATKPSKALDTYYTIFLKSTSSRLKNRFCLIRGPGPLPTQEYSFPPDQMCRRRKEFWILYELNLYLP